MCYSDGGDKDLGLSVFCADRLRFDCRHDSYFDTAPEPGEYLASSWNLGSPLNRFIAFDAPAPQRPACEDRLDNDGDGLRDFPVDPGCSAAADRDERDPARSRPSPASGSFALPYAGASPGVTVLLLRPPSPLPRLKLSSARRYARLWIKRRRPRARRIRAGCARRNRISARCRVSWSVSRRSRYRGRIFLRYRHGASGVVWAVRARLHRVHRSG